MHQYKHSHRAPDSPQLCALAALPLHNLRWEGAKHPKHAAQGAGGLLSTLLSLACISAHIHGPRLLLLLLHPETDIACNEPLTHHAPQSGLMRVAAAHMCTPSRHRHRHCTLLLLV